jgi:glycerophosphoryl diester phosphodiesterase
MRVLPYNIAHQGASGLAPSNTLAAFRRAVEFGADIIEIDIVTTADGVVVVSHDTTVDRYTTGVGRIDQMTLAQIKALDAGVRFGREFAGERIPTLAETLEWAKGQPIRLCIEIKGDFTAQYLGSARAAVPLLQQYDYVQRATITSFSPECVRTVKELEPLISIALDPEGQDGSRTPWNLVQQVLSCGANFVLHDHRALTAEIVEEMHQHGFSLWAWTANKVEDMRRIVATGADGIMTDRPDILGQVLAERRVK